MKHARTAIFKTLRLLTLVSACLAANAFADEYSDVSQLLRSNKFPEAMTKVDSYLAAKPADPQLRFLKGVIQRNMGKQAEAIVTFTKLTQDFPELPEPYNNLAVLYAGQGEYDKARVALEMAIRTNPSYATAHENIGDVYARLASQAYNKALQLDNNNAAVPPKLALIREVFKPNLTNPRPTPGASATAAAPPAPAPVATAKPEPAVAKPASKPEPAITAPVAVAPAVVPVAKPAANPVDTDAVKSAQAAVQAWAQAWENQDMVKYLAAYSPQFVPAGKQSRNAWEKERHSRIVGKSHISVTLNNLKISTMGDKATATFRQAYKSGSLSVSSRKTLEMQQANGKWLITRESTGN